MTGFNRRVPNCDDCPCKCEDPPSACSLNGTVSGNNVILTWSFSGVGIKSVKLYQRSTSSITDLTKNFTEFFSTDGRDSTRTVTVTGGRCRQYLLQVANECGVCTSFWSDDSVGPCNCYTCNYTSGGHTYTRRYKGIPFLGCGCKRGRTYYQTMTIRDLQATYTSDVDVVRTIGTNCRLCGCSCSGRVTATPGTYRYRLPYYTESTGADAFNGTYVCMFTEIPCDNALASPTQCLIETPYVKLGTYTYQRREYQSRSFSGIWSLEQQIPTCAEIANICETLAPATSCKYSVYDQVLTDTWEVYLIFSQALQTELTARSVTWGGSTNDPATFYDLSSSFTINLSGTVALPTTAQPHVSSPMAMPTLFARALKYPASYQSVKPFQTNQARWVQLEPSYCSTIWNCMALSFLGSGVVSPYYYTNPNDPCGMVNLALDRQWCNSPLNYEKCCPLPTSDCCMTHQYLVPPNIQDLFRYANAESIFTTEFAP